jgi:hypothetical protein
MWVALLLAIHIYLLAFQAFRDSPTLDEVGHLPAGVCHITTGDMSLYCVNPPLVRSVAAMPVVLMRPQTDWKGFATNPLSRWEFDVGRRFCEMNGERSLLMFAVARLLCIPFSLLGAVVVAMWSREWFGHKAGLLSATLWCFSPNLLAHGHLVTPDVAATSLGVTTCYLFTRWLREPTSQHTFLLGTSLALALLCKATWLVLFGVLLLQWILLRLFTPRFYPGLNAKHFAKLFVVVPVLALAGLNHFYAWEKSFTKLGEFQFMCDALGGDGGWEPGNRFERSWMAELPVPLPVSFVRGVDFQKRDFEQGAESYLRGEVRQGGGWWYYYLYGLAVKTPLGTMALVLIGITSCFSLARQRIGQARMVLLFTCPAAVFLFVSSQTGLNHLRYVLPVLPFAFVCAGASTLGLLGVSTSRQRGCIVVLLVTTIVESLASYPHCLSFFNVLAGGPAQGRFHLVDSSIDWGQDMTRLRNWSEQHPEARPLFVAAFGMFDPAVLDVKYRSPPGSSVVTEQAGMWNLADGWYVVSAHRVQGMRRLLMPRNDRPVAATGGYAYFQQLVPCDRIGYSLLVYQIRDGRSVP